ncbi:MAG TPA: flagellar biosynthetic protein FliR [Phycisphaerales bacterium]|nr:flagellar biosynthetic protein FliR [Phycisphaerales bacterium]
MDSQDINPLLARVVPYTLVAFRLAGVFVMAPLLVNIMIPRRFKALLVLMLAAAIFPIVSPSLTMAEVPTDLFGLVPLIVTESLVGVAIGGIAAIPLLSLEMSGIIAGQNMGMGLAKVYNPDADFETDILGQLIYYIGAGIFVAAGGLERLFCGVIDSFKNVPLGGFQVSQTPLDLFVGTLSSGFELAIRVSAPVTAIILLIIVVLGVVGKTMPQLNVLSVGFAIKIVAGLLMLTFALYAIRDAVGDEIMRVLSDIRGWVASL